MDKERIEGFHKAFAQGETYRWEIPKTEIECLEAMRDGSEYKTEIVLPVDLIKRESTRKL